ncbi:hypothetical protein I308_105762 [Cryptococcus tetragattii IND107]|uniref:Protein pal1 n=1 Tax=Cryptococcus tetragattii IND107 TaxID=1296105 RepID=A0ABR3BL23_9TREE|nr:hypothetical protein I308_06188 [Cryptococcus tetragattii IND107]
MTLLSKPSRSYANVEHDAEGLSAVGSGPYSSTQQGKKLSKKGDGFKTYRPPISETHLRRSLGYDPHPTSHFAPLPSAFQSHRVKKEQALAGQRAEADHLLQPGYRSHHPSEDADSSAPPRRTAGGLSGLRSSPSTSSFNGPAAAGSGRRAAGVYMDSSGKLHDTEYDPFAGVKDMTRAKSNRRSAFGSDRHRRAGSSSSSSSDSDQASYRRPSHDIREEEEVRRKLQIERQRMDDVSSYVARRKSLLSEREGSGRVSPSIRSSEDGLPAGGSIVTGRTKSQQGYYYPSPLSPSFATQGASFANGYPSRTPTISTFPASAGDGTPPEKSTEMTRVKSPPPPPKYEPPVLVEKPKPKSKVEVKDGTTKIIGFDGPVRPVSPNPPTEQFSNLRVRSPSPSSSSHHLTPPGAPASTGGGLSAASRSSADLTRQVRSPRPIERRHQVREDIYPETPAQTKRRQEREQRRLVSGHGPHAPAHTLPPSANHNNALAVDTALAESGRSRILPEIEIVEDDDPRIIFPKEGKTTRVQKTHDHVIKGPFSHALHARKGSHASSTALNTFNGASNGGPSSGIGHSSSIHDFSSFTRPKSLTGSKPGSSFIDDGGGYLPSRWASGDKSLRVTEDEREKYRPREWGGKYGDLGGREDEWRPTPKDQMKRNLKDIATSARFSLYRTKKKLLRKADL